MTSPYTYHTDGPNPGQPTPNLPPFQGPGDALGNNKPSQKKTIVGVIAGVVVLLLLLASVGIWALLGSGNTDDATAPSATNNQAPTPKATNASEIKFNTDLDATTLDLKLTGKSVKWENPCPGLYHLDPARPYILCDDKHLFEIRPDGSNQPIEGTYDSTKIRYGYVILHDDKGNDDRIFSIKDKLVSIVPKEPNSRIYFYTSEYFVRTYRDSDSLIQVQIIDALGQVIDQVVQTQVFQPSQAGNADIEYQNQGFFPVFPEKKNFIAFSDMVRNPPEQGKAKMDLSKWFVTEDGTAVFTGEATTGYKVTTYNDKLEAEEECQYPAFSGNIRVNPGQADYISQNLLTNQAFIDECKFFQDLAKNPLKDGEYLMLLPNGKHQRWSTDPKTGDASFNGVSYKDLTGQKIAAFFDHGKQLVARNGAVIQLGKAEPVFTTAQYSVPINYHCHKQFLLMDDRLWELAPAPEK